MIQQLCCYSHMNFNVYGTGQILERLVAYYQTGRIRQGLPAAVTGFRVSFIAGFRDNMLGCLADRLHEVCGVSY